MTIALYIFFTLFIICLVGVCVVAPISENLSDQYRQRYKDIKINDRYHIRTIKDPFNVSEKQIAVVIGKETSSVNDKHYILFVCNNVKYSCELNKFWNCWTPIPKNSHLTDYYIDTDITENYKDFRDEYCEEITKKQNNIARWE